MIGWLIFNIGSSTGIEISLGCSNQAMDRLPDILHQLLAPSMAQTIDNENSKRSQSYKRDCAMRLNIPPLFVIGLTDHRAQRLGARLCRNAAGECREGPSHQGCVDQSEFETRSDSHSHIRFTFSVAPATKLYSLSPPGITLCRPPLLLQPSI